MIQELDSAALTRDKPDKRLKQCDIGAVVFAYDNGGPFEAELVALKG